MEIELTVNKERSDAYAHGSGYGHVAVCADNLDSEHQRMAALDMKPTDIVSFVTDNSLLARFFCNRSGRA